MKHTSMQVPEEFQITPYHFKQYLVDGKLKTWEGATSEVYSTIRTVNAEGEQLPTLLGTIPDMESEAALEALESANTAYNRGQGKWPTMKVSSIGNRS